MLWERYRPPHGLLLLPSPLARVRVEAPASGIRGSCDWRTLHAALDSARVPRRQCTAKLTSGRVGPVRGRRSGAELLLARSHVQWSQWPSTHAPTVGGACSGSHGRTRSRSRAKRKQIGAREATFTWVCCPRATDPAAVWRLRGRTNAWALGPRRAAAPPAIEANSLRSTGPGGAPARTARLATRRCFTRVGAIALPHRGEALV